MAFLSKVNKGDRFQPSAERDNAIADAVNRLGRQGAGKYNKVIDNQIIVTVYNVSSEPILANTAASILYHYTGEMDIDCIMVEPYNITTSQWCIAVNDIAPHGIGECIIAGVVNVRCFAFDELSLNNNVDVWYLTNGHYHDMSEKQVIPAKSYYSFLLCNANVVNSAKVVYYKQVNRGSKYYDVKILLPPNEPKKQNLGISIIKSKKETIIENIDNEIKGRYINSRQIQIHNNEALTLLVNNASFNIYTSKTRHNSKILFFNHYIRIPNFLAPDFFSINGRGVLHIVIGLLVNENGVQLSINYNAPFSNKGHLLGHFYATKDLCVLFASNITGFEYTNYDEEIKEIKDELRIIKDELRIIKYK